MANKKISLLQCIALVSGNLVGSGVFMLPALLAGYGTISIAGWVLTSFGAIFLALVFARLSEQENQTNGGPHTFVRKAYGDNAAFWVAWGYWVLTWSSNTALLVAAVSYLGIILGGISPIKSCLIQMSIWAIVTLINLRGVQSAAKFECFITIFKLIPIVVIPALALFFIDFGNFKSIPLPSMGFFVALKSVIFLCLWGFIGVESATVPALEVDNPKKTIPTATIVGTLVATVVYVLGSVSTLGMNGVHIAQSSAPYADLATKIFGGSWGSVIAAIAVISCIGTFHGWCLVGARIAHGAALQGLFPKVFAKEDKKNTPVNSIIISSICTFITIFFTLQSDTLAQFEKIIDIAVTLILVIYLINSVVYFKLLKPKKLGAKLIGFGAALFSLFALYSSGLNTVINSLLLLLTGVPVYFYTKKIVY